MPGSEIGGSEATGSDGSEPTPNPDRAAAQLGPQASESLEAPPPHDIIIVGGTGALARRKLIPAIYSLHASGLLAAEGRIIAHARSDLDRQDFLQFARSAIEDSRRRELDEDTWSSLCDRLSYVGGGSDCLDQVAAACEQPRRLIYLATPPSTFGALAASFAEAGLADGSKIIIEKPFGLDVQSARELNERLHKHFDESQIFRIDHYLGKETVQNILVLRFGNPLFERLWHGEAIDHMQITVAEDVGIDGRGAFFEEVGALRDVLQNHALQVLTLLTMEPPGRFSPESIRDEKVKLLRAATPLRAEDVVMGQYRAGSIDGTPVRGYRDEEEVAPDSEVETYAAARIRLDNWRWGGMPVYLRVGKRLPRRVTEVHIAFRAAPVCVFEGTGLDELPANHMTIRIQPEEGITVTFLAKRPGPDIRVRPVRMHFSYEGSFMTEPLEAYERLLHDALLNDRMLFLREDGVEQAWKLVQPILDARPEVQTYEAGTWGPPQADALIAPRQWHLH